MNSLKKFLELNELEQKLFNTTKLMFKHTWSSEEKNDEVLVSKIVLGNITSTELFVANILMMNAIIEYFSLVFSVNPETLKKEADLALDELKKTIDKIHGSKHGSKCETEKEIALYLSLIKLLKELTYSLISAILEANYDNAGKIGAEIKNYDENLENDV